MRKALTLITMVLGAALAISNGLAQSASIEFRLIGALRDCAELHLPNSMARKPGFNLAAHLKTVEERYRLAAQDLASAAGVDAIRKFLVSNPDDLNTFCAVDLAGMTRRSEAQAILKRYANSTVPGVSNIARQYLKERK